MSTEDDTRFMRLALSLGRRGLGNCAPNPAVGCVIIRSGRVVGRGWTQPGGRPHAETEALSRAGKLAKGATVYVTLEPCSHHGQTPPCAEALIKAGVSRVCVATKDIDARVSGNGIAMLRDAGVRVDIGLCETEAKRDLSGFFQSLSQGRPHVTVKLASSFDGRIGTGTGHSQWITGPLARRFVHAMRARHDAVMVGAGTARKDNPELTVRGLGIDRQPARIIISRNLDLPTDGRLAQTAQTTRLFLCHGQDVDDSRQKLWTKLGASLVPCKSDSGQVDLTDAMQKLAALGVTRVFCEGGSDLAASLLKADLVDELVGFNAGLIIGADGLPSIGALEVDTISNAMRFELAFVDRLENEVMHVWRRTIL